MSNYSEVTGARRNNVQSAIAAFVGMAAAVPVSLMIYSATQPAQALQADMNKDRQYALYAQAFTQGFMANNDLGDGLDCEVPEHDDRDNGHDNGRPAGGFGVVSNHDNGDDDDDDDKLARMIKNSFHKTITTNIKNEDSNNTVQSVISVSHSNGAVVSGAVSSSGDASNEVDVENEESNNTENENSFNTDDSYNTVDSHNSEETTVTVEDSLNDETTNNTDNSKDIDVDVDIDESFNEETEIEVGKSHQNNQQNNHATTPKNS